jgi:hypothetical protein
LIGNPEGKRPLGRPRHMWEDNYKIYIKEIGRDDMDSIEEAEDRDQWMAVVNKVMKFRVQ